MEYNGIRTVNLVESKKEQASVYFTVAKEDEIQAKKIISVYMQQQYLEKLEANSLEETTNENLEESPEDDSTHGIEPYEKKTAKAEEFKSSAYTLLIVGIIGILFLILNYFGFIPIHMNTTTKYLVTSVMGAMFILFIILGIQSFRSAKKLQVEGKIEEDQMEIIMEHYTKSLSNGDIDEKAGIEMEVEEEIKYFKRIEVMKEIISHENPELSEGMLDTIADDIYARLF